MGMREEGRGSSTGPGDAAGVEHAAGPAGVGGVGGTGGSAGPGSGMLPGVAGISMFLLFVTMLNVYGAVSGAYGVGRARYGVLAVCTLLAVGIFGLLRLRRWGWALVEGGCLLLAMGDGFYFHKTHAGFFAVRALLEMVFFLYLARTEVRERLG